MTHHGKDTDRGSPFFPSMSNDPGPGPSGSRVAYTAVAVAELSER